MHLTLIGSHEDHYPEVFKPIHEIIRKLDENEGYDVRDDSDNVDPKHLGLDIPQVEGYYTSLVLTLDSGLYDFRVYKLHK